MALSITTPYKNNTVSSVSGTTFNSNGTPFVAGDVGRCIVITSGNARGQMRKIVSYTDNNTVEVDYAWNVSPFSDYINDVTSSPFAEVNPSSGDSWSMSHFFDDIDDTTNVNKINASIYELVGTNVLTIGANVFLYDRNITVYCNTIYFDVDDEGFVRFGDIDEDGDVFNGIHFIDLCSNSTPRSWTNSMDGDAGDIHFYASLITIYDGSGGIFWSLYESADAIYRFVGCEIHGTFGMRIRGDDTIIKDCEWQGEWTGTIYGETLNPYGTIGMINNVKIFNKIQVFYWNQSFGGFIGRNVSFKNITDYFLFSAESGTGDTTIIGFDADEVEAMTYIVGVDTACPNSTLYLRNPIITAVIDTDLDPITDSYKRVVWNPSDVAVSDSTVTDGTWDSYDALWWEYTFTTTGDKTKADGITTEGYFQAIISYKYKPNTLQVTGRQPSDSVFTGILDAFITEATKSVVDAYSSILNANQFYDRAKAWSFDNFDDAFPDKGEQIVNGDGTVLDLGDIDLILDSDAGSAFSVNQSGDGTITIKSGGTADIQRVGATEAVSTGEDDEITIAFPGGVQADDVAYIIVGHAQSEENAWNTPSGWVIPTGLTEVQTGGSPTSVPGVSVFRRVLTGGEGSDVTITNVGTNVSGIVAQMIVYRNVDTTTPEDVNPTTASGASGDPDPASITTTNDGCMILAIGFMDDGDQGTPTQPSGYTAINDTATLDGGGTGE